VFAFLMARVWDRFKDAHWRVAIQAGLVPVSIGLVAASAYVVTGAADHTWVAAGLSLATAAVATFTRINPLWTFACAGALGLSGLL
jgi:chromate transporter